MNRTKTATQIIAMFAATLAGCAHDGIVKVDNAERAATVWGEPAAMKGANGAGLPHVCLEYSTPAQQLASTKSSLSVPVGGQAISLSHESAENLATIYSVSEIMQFGHAALYRLCEAAGNGSIKSNDDYYKLFAATLEQVHGLIRLQLEKDSVSALNLLDRWHDEIEGYDRRRCLLRQSDTTEARKADNDLTDKRTKLAARYEDLRAAQKLSELESFALPKDDLPSFQEFALVRRFETARSEKAGSPPSSHKDPALGYQELVKKYASSSCPLAAASESASPAPASPPPAAAPRPTAPQRAPIAARPTASSP